MSGEYKISNQESFEINYKTNNYDVKFNVSFGEGKDSLVILDEYERKNFKENYNIEVYEKGNKTDDNYMIGYRVVANEGPIVVKLDNIEINSYDNNYIYALGFALDTKNPEYASEYNTIPYNIDRDGTMWTIPANNNISYKFDQNPKAQYQWVTKKAMDIDYKPTNEEKMLGLEETTETTGLIYLSFMLFQKRKENQEPTRGATRGVTRGATRGATRGGDSVGARFGYGNEANSSSVKSDYIYIPNTEKYILPIRVRINKDSKISDINCSETLKGAEISALKKQTMTIPF